MKEPKKCQIIKCNGCGAVFAGSLEPYCYSDPDWQREMRKYVKAGKVVSVIPVDEFKINHCTCVETPKADPQLSLL